MYNYVKEAFYVLFKKNIQPVYKNKSGQDHIVRFFWEGGTDITFCIHMEAFQAIKSTFVYFKVEVLAPQAYLSWYKHYALMIHVDKWQLTKCGTTVLLLRKGRQMFFIYLSPNN